MKIRVNPIALNDLMEIRNYISTELANPVSAMKIVSDIIESYERLCEFPLLGATLSTKLNIPTDFRFLVCHNYLIFYKASDEFVSIYRILYARRDYTNLLMD